MFDAEIFKSLSLRSHKMIFARSSSCNKHFNVKVEVGKNFSKTVCKPSEKHAANKSNKLFSRCGSKPQLRRSCPAISKIFNTIMKIPQNWAETNPIWIQVREIDKTTIVKKKMFLPSKHLQDRWWECFMQENSSLACLRHGNISQKKCKVKLQVNNAAQWYQQKFGRRFVNLS